MEEKDLHLEPEEDKDVEGHMDLGTDVGKVDAGHADDDDDVEGHVDLNREMPRASPAPNAIRAGFIVLFASMIAWAVRSS